MKSLMVMISLVLTFFKRQFSYGRRAGSLCTFHRCMAVDTEASSWLASRAWRWLWAVLLPVEVLLYGSYAVLVNLSKVHGELPYLSTSYVLCTEMCKLTITTVLLFYQELRIEPDPEPEPDPYSKHESGLLPEKERCRRPMTARIVMLFAVPAACYCVNNNLSVLLQRFMDPASFQVLENFKIVTTTLLFRIVMERPLSRRQCAAVALLTAGSVIHSWSALHAESAPLSEVHVTPIGLLLLGCSCVISAFASVFTEYLFKQHNDLSVVEQTGLLYVFGVLFNFLMWLCEANSKPEHGFYFFKGYSSYTYLLVATQVLCGLIMALIMKYLNNMVKVFIVAGAPLVTTILAYYVFDLRIQLEFLVPVSMVIVSVLMYSS